MNIEYRKTLPNAMFREKQRAAVWMVVYEQWSLMLIVKVTAEGFGFGFILEMGDKIIESCHFGVTVRRTKQNHSHSPTTLSRRQSSGEGQMACLFVFPTQLPFEFATVQKMQTCIVAQEQNDMLKYWIQSTSQGDIYHFWVQAKLTQIELFSPTKYRKSE